MRRALIALLVLAPLGAACSHRPPEPIVLTRTEILTRQAPIATVTAPPTPIVAPAAPAAAPCQPRLSPPPAYPDRDEALRDAPSIYEQVQMLLAGRRMRMARERELADALRACMRAGR